MAEYFAELARRLLTVESVEATMEAIVTAAVDVVDECGHASLSHTRGKSLLSRSSNDDIGIILDGIQTGAQEGPCLDAIRHGEVIVAPDLRIHDRWPAYAPRAVESTGVISSMAYPLHEGPRIVGALNLFSDQAHGFTGETEQEAVVAILAAHATPALVAALRREDFAAALRSRDIIGQAKGLLMARSSIDAETAFDMLVRASQRTNRKLAEVAESIVTASPSDGPRR